MWVLTALTTDSMQVLGWILLKLTHMEWTAQPGDDTHLETRNSVWALFFSFNPQILRIGHCVLRSCTAYPITQHWGAELGFRLGFSGTQLLLHPLRSTDSPLWSHRESQAILAFAQTLLLSSLCLWLDLGHVTWPFCSCNLFCKMRLITVLTRQPAVWLRS
jgi:hypothetical protein